MVRKTLLAFFERLNKKYGNHGIEFDVRDNHYWIEIKINKKKSEAWRRQVNYDPNSYDTDEDIDRRKKTNSSGSHVEGGNDSQNANYGPINTDGVLHTAARDDDNSRLIKSTHHHGGDKHNNNHHDQFENDDNVSEILKKMK